MEYLIHATGFAVLAICALAAVAGLFCMVADYYWRRCGAAFKFAVLVLMTGKEVKSVERAYREKWEKEREA